MSPILSRGYEIQPDCRIKKAISNGNDWNIYSTSTGAYVLTVSPTRICNWKRDGLLRDDIFMDISDHHIHVFISSSSEYMISTISDGPFPEKVNQVTAFATTFGSFVRNYPNIYFTNAIYIEELSILLPVEESNSQDDLAVAYGRWLTGGVAISGKDIDRLSRFMSWMPKKTLEKCSDTACVGYRADTQKYQRESCICTNDNIVVKDAFRLLGRPELEAFFNDNILDVIEHEDEYKRMGISFPGATILYGPPGCGKTFAVDQLADYLGWSRFDIEAGTIASPYIHDTSKKIADVFNEAIKAAPSILVIDEMEAFLSDRASAASANHHVEEVAEFLRRIPEAIEHHVLIFAMTNMIDSIDPAILRRGRFDHKIEVKMASASEIEELLKNKLDNLPVSSDVQIPIIAERLAGHPLSDVSFIIKEAGRIAVKNHKQNIDNECFNVAFQSMPTKKEKETRRIGF